MEHPAPPSMSAMTMPEDTPFSMRMPAIGIIVSHTDVHGYADHCGERDGPEVVRARESLKKLGRHEPVDERPDACAEEQPAEDTLEQPNGIRKGVLAGLRLLLPERSLQVLPCCLVAPAASTLNGNVLDVAREPDRVEHEPRAYREREGNDGVDRRCTGPKNTSRSAIIAGLSIGEVIRNEIAPEKGAPLLKRPTKTGMVEHEQNGVTAPSAAPRIALVTLCGRESMRLMRSLDTHTCSRATKKLMATKSRNSSPNR